MTSGGASVFQFDDLSDAQNQYDLSSQQTGGGLVTPVDITLYDSQTGKVLAATPKSQNLDTPAQPKSLSSQPEVNSVVPAGSGTENDGGAKLHVMSVGSDNLRANQDQSQKHWYSGVTNFFSATGKAIANTATQVFTLGGLIKY